MKTLGSGLALASLLAVTAHAAPPDSSIRRVDSNAGTARAVVVGDVPLAHTAQILPVNERGELADAEPANQAENGVDVVFSVRMRLEDMEEEPLLTGGRLGAAEERIRDGDMPLSFSTEEHGTVAAEVIEDAGTLEPADLLGLPLLLQEAECHGANRTDVYPRLQCDEETRLL